MVAKRNCTHVIVLENRSAPLCQVSAFLIGMMVLIGTLWLAGDAWGGRGAGPAIHDSVGQTSTGSSVFLISDLGDERLVTAGLGIKTADDSSFILRSYDAETGSLIVEDEFELSVDEDSAAAIESGGGRVYAVGSGLNSEGKLSLLVRAYEAWTGKLLWEDELNAARGPQIEPAGFGGPVRRGPFVRNSENRMESVAQSQFLVQALDPEQGEILWEDEFLTNAPRHMKRARPYRLSNRPPGEVQFSILVRTFDRESGELLWQDRFYPAETEEGATGEGNEEPPGGPSEKAAAFSPDSSRETPEAPKTPEVGI